MIKLQFAVKQQPKADRFRKRFKRALKPIRPSRVAESAYRADLQSVARRVIDKVNEVIVPYLKANQDLITLRATDAMPEDEIRRRIGEIRRQSKVDPVSAEHTATRAAKRVRASVDERLAAEIRRSVGVNIAPTMLDNSQITPALNKAVKENVDLITSIPDQYLDRVERGVVQAVITGQRHETLAKIIHAIGQSTMRRAEIIARDQTAKMNGSFNRIRQTAVGIDKYMWSTSKDERVRESHVENEGKTFRWDTPPEETGHPGEDIMCRCVAIPVFDLDEMGKENTEKFDDLPLPVLYTFNDVEYSKGLIPNAYEEKAISSYSEAIKVDKNNLSKMLAELEPYDTLDPVKSTVQEIPLGLLTTVQSVVRVNSVKKYDPDHSPITVYKMPESGKLIIKNGSHRATAALLSGKTKIKARILEFK